MKKIVLPALAAALVLAAVLVFVFVPKNAALPETADETAPGILDQRTGTAAAPRTDAVPADRDANENVVIPASALSADRISFYRIAEGDKTELIAILGEDGMPRAALGTCASCNGSPYAYYVQAGDELQCNNCHLTFPLSVIGEEGSGCHPIMIAPAGLEISADGIVIDAAVVAEYAPLFEKITDH